MDAKLQELTHQQNYENCGDANFFDAVHTSTPVLHAKVNINRLNTMVVALFCIVGVAEELQDCYTWTAKNVRDITLRQTSFWMLKKDVRARIILEMYKLMTTD